MNPGSKLGNYEIVSRLGAGGMGVVYLARDTRLDRQVAIKALPEQLASDPDRLARFEREAKIVASLNHPGIAAVYALEEHAGKKHLVMEYVEGETMASRLKRGVLPIDEALEVARQIAEALEAAHEKGVIHRDLKPGNVMLTPEGRVKVLDFGLARTADAGGLPAAGLRAADANSPTMTLAAPACADSPTIPGAILGTAGYMSPEQARGKPVDKRSDIFSFGCLFFEMLTGAQPFRGETVTDSLGAVLHRDPDWALLPAGAPARLRELLTTCLAKDRRSRMRDIGDVRLAIENAGAAWTDEAIPAAQARLWLPWAVVAALCAVIAAGAWLRAGAKDPAPPVVRSVIEITPGFLINDGNGPVAISPDGRTLAFVAGGTGETPRIWLRPMDSLSAHPLQETENATYPFWSPDSKQLGYFAGGKMRRIPVTGGTPVALADVEEPRGGSWSIDGTIVFAPNPRSALMRMPATGGTPTSITQTDTEVRTHRLPFFLPDGKRLLYSSSIGGYDKQDNEIMLLDLESGTSVSLVNAQSLGLYAPPGYLLFVNNSALMAQRLDVAAGKVVGEPVVLAEQVSITIERLASPISVSSDGLLVYRPVRSLARLEWFDTEGRALGTVGEPADYQNISLSPSGDQAVATITREGGKFDVWIIDLVRGTRVRVVEDVASVGACWCPTTEAQGAAGGGRKIVYWDRSDKSRIREIDGLGSDMNDTALAEGFVSDWSPDGKTISLVRQTKTTHTDLYLADVATGQVRPFLVTSDYEEFGMFSPDSKWIAYTSTRSGKMELFVAPLSNPGAARPLAPLTRSCFLAWLDDGTLIYSDPTGARLTTVTTKITSGVGGAAASIELGTPKPAFGGMEAPSALYAITRDGKRLLAAVPLAKGRMESLVLLQNWQGTIATGR